MLAILLLLIEWVLHVYNKFRINAVIPFFLIVIEHNMNFTILAIFKYTVWWY